MSEARIAASRRLTRVPPKVLSQGQPAFNRSAKRLSAKILPCRQASINRPLIQRRSALAEVFLSEVRPDGGDEGMAGSGQKLKPLIAAAERPLRFQQADIRRPRRQ